MKLDTDNPKMRMTCFLLCIIIIGCEDVSLSKSDAGNSTQKQSYEADALSEYSKIDPFCVHNKMHVWYMNYSTCLAEGRKANKAVLDELNEKYNSPIISKDDPITVKIDIIYERIHKTCLAKEPKPKCERIND